MADTVVFSDPIPSYYSELNYCGGFPAVSIAIAVPQIADD